MRNLLSKVFGLAFWVVAWVWILGGTACVWVITVDVWQDKYAPVGLAILATVMTVAASAVMLAFVWLIVSNWVACRRTRLFRQQLVTNG